MGKVSNVRITEAGLIILAAILSIMLYWLFAHHKDTIPCPDHNSVYQVTVDDNRNIVTCKVKL